MKRNTQYNKVDQQFLTRRSSRSFIPAEIPTDDFEAMIEAARLSPSCYNDQPWIFYVADSEIMKSHFLSILAETNRAWANNAGKIMLIGARKQFKHNGKLNGWSRFDLGAAWMALAMQANLLGYSAHAMAGLDFEKAYKLLNIDQDSIDIVCAVAIGRPDNSNIKFSDRQSATEMVRYFA